jgi:threonine/homoserine/homoserine lactone efflux protein
VAGLGAFLTASTGTLTVVKWAGVTYLAWLGVTALRRARYTTAVAVAVDEAGRA